MTDFPPRAPGAWQSIGQAADKVVEAAVQVMPTKWKGITYRSRTEARWAVLFDALGVATQYEPEGYDLGSMAYLPDFFVVDWDLFVEVKGQPPTEREREKAARLAGVTGKATLIVVGDPGLRRGELFSASPDWRDDCPEMLGSFYNAMLGSCRRCGAAVVEERWGDPEDGLWAVRPVGAGCNDLRCGDKPNYEHMDSRMRGAIAAALNERFERKRGAA